MNDYSPEKANHTKKIAVFFMLSLLIAFSVYFILSAIKKPVDIKKEKAAETLLTLSVNTASQPVEVGDTFEVDLMIDTKADKVSAVDLKLNYNSSVLVVDSVRLGEMFPVVLRSPAVNQGSVSFALGCEPTAPVQGKNVLATIVFTAISAGQANMDYDTASQIAAIGENTNALNLSTGNNLTISSQSSTGPTPTGSNEPTPTGAEGLIPTPTGSLNNIKINIVSKFQGILEMPVEGFLSQMVKVSLLGTGQTTPATSFSSFTVDGNLDWSGTSLFNVPFGKYDIFIKGPKHIQKKVKQIDLTQLENDIDTTDGFLLTGDLSPQDGIINSYDISLIRNNLGKKDQAILNQADLNLDGIIDTQDYSLAIVSLSNRDADEVN